MNDECEHISAGEVKIKLPFPHIPSDKRTTLMNETIEALPRRDQARLSPEGLARKAYGPFCDAVRRLACLTPTQKLLAGVLAGATLKQGFTSLAFGSLSELTQVRPHAKPFAGLGKNDLSVGLNALRAFGLIRLEERSPLEAGVLPVSLLLIIADANQWSVSSGDWLFSDLEEMELMQHLLAMRQRWTAQLPELAESADLHDARAALAVEAVTSTVNALVVPEGRDRSARRVGASPGSTSDAREVCRTRQTHGEARGRSDFRNAETPEKAGGVLEVGTPVKQLSSLKQKTVQQLNSFKADDSNRLLAMLRVQFVRVHGEAWTEREMANSGAAWRMVARAWPEEFEVQIGEMRNFIDGGGKIKCAWAYFQNYFKRAVGCATWQAVCKKSKESLSTHC